MSPGLLLSSLADWGGRGWGGGDTWLPLLFGAGGRRPGCCSGPPHLSSVCPSPEVTSPLPLGGCGGVTLTQITLPGVQRGPEWQLMVEKLSPLKVRAVMRGPPEHWVGESGALGTPGPKTSQSFKFAKRQLWYTAVPTKMPAKTSLPALLRLSYTLARQSLVLSKDSSYFSGAAPTEHPLWASRAWVI